MVGVELNVVDGYHDDTAQRNSCTKPVCISTDSMWIVLDLFLLHPSWDRGDRFRINQDFLIEHSCILHIRSNLLLL